MAKRKKKNQIFSRNQMTPGTMVRGQIDTGGSQPPKNRIDSIAHMKTTFRYSPIMKRRYGVDEYSTMNPATSSDSASGRSKGGRFVSASAETKNTTNIGNRMVKANQPCSCARTMAERLSEPANSRTVMITKPMDTS